MKSLINITAVATILVLGGAIVTCDLAIGSIDDGKTMPTLDKVMSQGQTAATKALRSETKLTVHSVGWKCYKHGGAADSTVWSEWTVARVESDPSYLTSDLAECIGDHCVIRRTIMTYRVAPTFYESDCPNSWSDLSFTVDFGTAVTSLETFEELTKFYPGTVWTTNVPISQLDGLRYIPSKSLTRA